MSIRSRARVIGAIARGTSSFANGYRELWRTHMTPEQSYYSLRRLYCLTNGRFNNAASRILSLFHPPTELPQADSILGDVTNSSIARIVRDIETNGFHVFDRKLPSEIVNTLHEFAETIPCQAILTSSEQKLGSTRTNRHYTDSTRSNQLSMTSHKGLL